VQWTTKTKRLADVLTDLVALPKEQSGCHFEDNDSFDSMYCHEGIFIAAVWMAEKFR
jgi:hypothetical protein